MLLQFFKSNFLADVRSIVGRFKLVLLVIILSSGMAGCAGTPETLNPGSWFSKVSNIFEDDEKNKKQRNKSISNKDVNAESKYPTLRGVPQGVKTTSEKKQKGVSSGLVSDRDAVRQYSDQIIKRQGEVSGALNSKGSIGIENEGSAVKPISLFPENRNKETSVLKQKSDKIGGYVSKTGLRPDLKPSEAKITSLSSKITPKSIAKRKVSIPKFKDIRKDGKLALKSEGGVLLINGSGVNRIFDEIPQIKTLGSLNAQNRTKQLATILFPNGSSKLSKYEINILRNLAKRQKSRGGILKIIGHASSRTANLGPIRHKFVNFNISSDRALAVKTALVRLGASANRIEVAAVSDTMPKYRENMPNGEAGNRRAEIFLIY